MLGEQASSGIQYELKGDEKCPLPEELIHNLKLILDQHFPAFNSDSRDWKKKASMVKDLIVMIDEIYRVMHE